MRETQQHGSLFMRIMMAAAAWLILSCLPACGERQGDNSLDVDQRITPSLPAFEKTTWTDDLNFVLPLPGTPAVMVSVGDAGTIMRSGDGGRTWSLRDSTTTSHLLGATALDASGQTLVVVGDDGTILRSEDRAQTWAARSSNTTQALLHCIAFGTNGKAAMAVGENGTIVLSKDGGLTWTAQDSKTKQHLRHALALDASGQTLLAVGDGGAIVRSEDGGQTWARKDAATKGDLQHAIALGADGQIVLAVGTYGTILRSDNGGRSWAMRDAKVGGNLAQVMALGAEGKTVIALGGFGSSIRSDDRGQTWTEQGWIGSQFFSRAIALADGQTLIAAGRLGGIFRSEDGGQTWRERDSTTNRPLLHIALSADGKDLIAVGKFGTIVRSEDGGQTWTPDPKVTDNLWFTLASGADGKTLVTVGENGAIARSEDGGRTWTRRDAMTTNALAHAVALGKDGKTLVAVGSHGAIVRSENGGLTWKRQPSDAVFRLAHVLALGPNGNTVLAVGSGGTIVRSEDGGLTWAPQDAGTGLNLNSATAVGHNGKTIVAVGEGGLIVRSENGGLTWAKQDAKTERDLSHVVTLGKDGNTIVAVGHEAIVRSEDGGLTWTERPTQTKKVLLHAIAFGTNGKTLVAVGEGGAILRSEDGGLAWSERNSQTQHSLLHASALDAEGHALLVVGDNGTIVRSEDGGLTWARQDSKTKADFRHGIALGTDEKTLLVTGAGGTIVRTNAQHRQPTPILTSANTSYTGAQRTPLLRLTFAQPPDHIDVQGFSHQDHTLWKGAKHWLEAEAFLEKRLRPIEEDGAVTAVKNTKGREWEIALDPAKLSAESQQPLYARVAVHGPGFHYTYPGPNQFFEVPNHPAPMPPWLMGAVALVGFSLFLLALSMWQPLLLLRLASQGGVEPEGITKLLAEPVNWALQLTSKALMPILTRQPWVLDAWVRQHHEQLHQAFLYGSSGMTEQSSSYEALPVQTSDGTTFKPEGPAIQQLLKPSSNCLQIVARGGAGKTRLAIQIGRWLFAGEVTPYPAAALLVDDEFDDLWKHLQQRIVRTLGVESTVPAPFLAALVRKGRLWIIVDRLSERNPKTQAAFGAVFDHVSPHALICTARRVMAVNPVRPIVIEPLPLDKSTLLGFLESQMRAEGASQLSLSWKDVATLVDRLAQQVTLGGRELPVTPLLVKVFVRQAMEALRRSGDQALQKLPSSIPEAYFRYVERLDDTQSNAEGRQAASMRALVRKAATLLARVELGEDFRPKPVPQAHMEEALQALSQHQGIDFVSRFLACGLLSARQIGAEARLEFFLDPLAECLAAHEHALACGRDEPRWQALIQQVTQLGVGGRGFMLALHMNHAAYRHELGFPDVEFPGELGEERQHSPSMP